MATLDIALLKKHVRADDFAADDEYLLHLLEAAETHLCHATNRPMSELTDENGELPHDLQHATLLLVGHWYNQREAVSNVQMAAVPYAVSTLIAPHCKLVSE